MTSIRDTKFKISGEIESPKESDYLKNIEQQNAQKFRLWAIILGSFLAFSIGIVLWQSFKISTLKALTKTAHQTNINATSDSVKNRLDSLLQTNLQLQLANEALLENSDDFEGIFFEIHIKFKGDFDLKKYKSEMAKIQGRPLDERDALVLARFSSYKKALLFENDLKKMGFKEIELLGRVNGTIMTFKETMQLAKEKNN
ncbi:MAG: hypothetical protein H6607_00025 [Flavobacteriales bacterium]|nr:hypothetical protein [Flavobacteriales bacterium]